MCVFFLRITYQCKFLKATKKVFFSPFSFLSAKGAAERQYGQLSNHPSMVKARDPLHCTVGDANFSPRTTLQVCSDKTSLCSKVDELNKNIFSGWRKQEKEKVEEEAISERRNEEVTWWGGGRRNKVGGDRSSLRHGSVSDGVSSQCTLGSAVLSSPDSWRPPLAPAWRPTSVSWLRRPAPARTQSATMK